jgi:hypothetical protein
VDIRGLTADEIRECLFRLNQDTAYSGNIEFVRQHYKVPNPDYNPERDESWHKNNYVADELRPLNKRGDRFSARLKVRSARRPGSRVSQERWSYYGPVDVRQKRINSACWHAHRDFLAEVFDVNPEAKVISALATYDGRDDFERKFPNTYEGQGMSGPAPISNIGAACNCDEGDYPEFAVEGLTVKQYNNRAWLWDTEDDYPNGSKRALKKPETAILPTELAKLGENREAIA